MLPVSCGHRPPCSEMKGARRGGGVNTARAQWTEEQWPPHDRLTNLPGIFTLTALSCWDTEAPGTRAWDGESTAPATRMLPFAVSSARSPCARVWWARELRSPCTRGSCTPWRGGGLPPTATLVPEVTTEMTRLGLFQPYNDRMSTGSARWNHGRP